MKRCDHCGREHRRRGKRLCLFCDKPVQCQRCGIAPDDGKLYLADIYLCGKCFEEDRAGRDQSTRMAAKSGRALRDKAEALRMESSGDEEYANDYRRSAAQASAELAALKEAPVAPTVSLGEVVPEPPGYAKRWIKETLDNPDVAAMEASAERTSLCLQGGTDVAALALDASNSIQAENSLEKMLVHQLAVLHKASMKTMSRATRYASIETAEQVRLMNAAARAMDVFQRGLLTLQRLRSGGQQTVVVQHIQVEQGAQAVIGPVQTGGDKGNER